MPTILRWFTWMCFGFALFLPVSLMPVGGYYIGDESVTLAEFWRRGGGPMFFVAGIMFPVCGYGFVRARDWARYLFVALHAAVVVVSLLVAAVSWDILLEVGWLAFIVYNLFWSPAATAYFAREQHQGI